MARAPLVPQAFISHTGNDQAAAQFATIILKQALEKIQGLKVFLDCKPGSLPLGSDWTQMLTDAAANSTIVVVVLSKSFTERFWCMLELDLALNSNSHSHRKPLVIPVFYDKPDDVVKVDSILEYWSQPEVVLEAYLMKEEKLGPEWLPVVDAPRWAGNISAMLALQHERLKNAPKDDAEPMTERIVKAVEEYMAADPTAGTHC
jgi:hypothetical protein